MADKLIVNCSKNEIIETSFTEEELIERELDRQRQEEDANKPKDPTTEERLQMAEDTIMFLLMGGM